jgi:hypothetical protein
MLKPWIGLGIGLFLTACAVVPGDIDGGENSSIEGTGSMPSQVDGDEMVDMSLEDLGPAPELENEVWLNTDEPLRLANLRGHVVLLDMWTFG